MKIILFILTMILSNQVFAQTLDLPIDEATLEEQLAINEDDLMAQYFTVDSLLIATKERLLDVEAGGFEYNDQIVKIPFTSLIPGILGAGIFYSGALGSWQNFVYREYSLTLDYVRHGLKEYYELSYDKNVLKSQLSGARALLATGADIFDSSISGNLNQRLRLSVDHVRGYNFSLLNGQHVTRAEVLAFIRNTEPLYQKSVLDFTAKRLSVLRTLGNATLFSPFILMAKIPVRMIAGGALIFYSYQQLTDNTVIIDSKTLGDIRDSVRLLEEKLESLTLQIGEQ